MNYFTDLSEGHPVKHEIYGRGEVVEKVGFDENDVWHGRFYRVKFIRKPILGRESNVLSVGVRALS